MHVLVRRLVRHLWVLACATASLMGHANPSGAEKALEIGLLPNVSARVLLQQYEPMQRYLNGKIARQTQFSSASNWSAFYQRAGKQEFDVVIAASNVGRLIEKDFGFRPILAYQPKIPALFVTLSGTNASPGEILKGKSLVFANPASLVALEGQAWLRSQGLQAGKDYQSLTVRTEDSVGNTLLRGDAAAGILSMGEFRNHPPDVRDKLKIHSTFKEVAGFWVLVSPRLSAAQQNELRQHLLAFGQDPVEGTAFFARTGFKAIVPLSEPELQQLDAFTDATRNALKN